MLKKNKTSKINKTQPDLYHSDLHHYKKVLSNGIFNSLSESDKKKFFNQIKSVEKDLEHKNTIKIRVRPWMIKLLCKLARVHDIRWWAYRGNTIYVWHSSDLFIPQLLQHEGIHIAQQVELWWFKVWWFIKRLVKTMKDMKKYKENHWDSPYIQYESSTLIPMELEAYVHQWEKWYLKDREPFAYKKYETPKWEQEAFKKIEMRNNTEIGKDLENKINVEYDLDRLQEITEKTKDTERTMWVFNSVDNIIEINNLLPILEKKLYLIQNNPDLYTFSDEIDRTKYQKMHWNIVDEFRKLKFQHSREGYKYNIQYMFEDDFNNQEVVENAIKQLKEDLETYRRTPARFRLEPKKSNTNESIQIEISPKI